MCSLYIDCESYKHEHSLTEKKDYLDAALFSLLCAFWILVVLFNTTYLHTEYVLSAQHMFENTVSNNRN